MSGKDTFHWDPISAGRKLVSDSTVNVNVSGGPVSAGISKNIPKHDPKQDAYRNCSICGRHYNYHKNGQCPK